MEQGKKANAFTRQEIEQHLQSALTAAAPDIWSKLELQIATEQEKGHKDMSVEKQKQKNILILHRRIRRASVAAAACICLTAFGGYYHYQYLQVASQVEIDVNPSLKLSLNRKEKVIKAEALNEDGKALLDGGGLTGQNVTAAVGRVVDSLVEQGYLDQESGECALLVSVAGKNPRKAEQLKTAVSQDVEAALAEKEVCAVVYDQVIQVTEELEELADTYQVSLGKAEFVGQLIQENTSLSQEQQDAYARMMGQTMEELTQEIDEKSYSLSANVTIIKTEALPSRDRAEESSGMSTEAPQDGKKEDREVSDSREEALLTFEPDAPAGSGEMDKADKKQNKLPSEAERPTEETVKIRESESQPADEATESSEQTEMASPDTGEMEKNPLDPSFIMEAQGGKDDLMVSVKVEEEPDPPSQPIQENEIAVEETEGTSQPAQDMTEEPSQPVEETEAGEEPSQPAEETEAGEEPSQPAGETEAGEEPSQPSQERETEEESSQASQDREEEQPQPSQDREEEQPQPSQDTEIEEEPSEPSQDAPSYPVQGQPVIDPTTATEGPADFTSGRLEEHEPGEKETEAEDNRQIIPSADEVPDDFGPGDVSAPREEGMTITERGTVIIVGEEEEKEWKEPVYASQMLSGFERSLLQKGPGMFFGRIAEDGQETLLRYGPGFAYIYEGDRYRGSDYTRIRIKPSKGKVYRVDSAE